MGKDLKGKELGKGFSQRKDGRYEARAVVKGVKIDLYNLKLPELKKEFERKKAEVLRDEAGVRPNVTLKEWCDEWFEKCKQPSLKNITCAKAYYRRISNTYIALLGDKRMEDLQQTQIQVATNELAQNGYIDRTIKEALSILNQCCEIAVANRIIPFNPCIGISIKNTNIIKERRVMTRWEQRVFLAEVENKYYRELYNIMLLTGMRIGEIGGLQWEDIDWEEKVIRIRRSLAVMYSDGEKTLEITTPKTANSYRSIPFFSETEQFLLDWKVKQDALKKKLGKRWRADPKLGNLVFTTSLGSPIIRHTIAHDINKTVRDIRLKEHESAIRENRPERDFKPLHPHAFRHTFATRCFEKGLEPIFVQSIMGHSSYATTISYTHVLDDLRHREVQKAGNFLETQLA